MSRITKQIAEEVAAKLVATKKEKLKERNLVFSQKITELCWHKVPSDIAVLFEEYPQYFNTSSTFRPSGNGWNSQYLSLVQEVPSIYENSFSFEMEVKTSNALLKEHNRNNDEKDKIKMLERDLVHTLLNLKTYKSVTENFPEAAAYLPKIVNNTIALNLSDIRNRIK